MHYFIVFMLISFGAATIGSLIGSGGGFILMPVLLLLYNGEQIGGRVMTPTELTFISLCASVINGWTASFNYGRMGRIDYRTAFILAAFTIPAAIVARLLLGGVGKEQFGGIFGIVLIAIGAFILWRVCTRGDAHEHKVTPKPNWTQRRIKDSSGIEYAYAFDLRIGVSASVAGGFIASFFGIGGGVFQVPVMTQLLHFPAHVAAATSILILSVGATAGVITDVVKKGGDVSFALAVIVGIGSFLGAQLGTRLAKRISGRKILWLLALALILAGGKLLCDLCCQKRGANLAPPTRKTQRMETDNF